MADAGLPSDLPGGEKHRLQRRGHLYYCQWLGRIQTWGPPYAKEESDLREKGGWSELGLGPSGSSPEVLK